MSTASSVVHKQSSQWIKLQAVPSSFHQSEKDCKHNLYTHTAYWVIQWIIQASESTKPQPCNQELCTWKFGADTGNIILVFPAKNTSASSTASGYGLPFNSHSETTNILCNKQIQLAWIEIHAVLLPNFLQPCCSIQWLGSRDKSSPLPSAEQYTLECLMVFAESFHQQMCNICLSYSANFILEFASSCPPQNHVNPKRKTLKS